MARGKRGTTTATLSPRELEAAVLHVAGFGPTPMALAMGIKKSTARTVRMRAALKLTGSTITDCPAFLEAARAYLETLTDSPAIPPAGDLTPASSNQAPAVSSQETP